MKSEQNSQEQLQATISKEIDNPRLLEQLYRTNPAAFQRAFDAVYPSLADSPFAVFWHERLSFSASSAPKYQQKDILFVFIGILVSGIIAQIPTFIGQESDFFLQRNISYVLFPMVMLYFARKNEMSFRSLLFPILALLVTVLYINLLPENQASDTFQLACLHLPIFLWVVTGFTFVGGNMTNAHTKMAFLRYNGDLLVMAVIILLAGGVFTGITLGLFSLIGFNIADFYFNRIAVWGLAGLPVVATFFVQENPQLVGKISPLIAKIFTPLVLATLTTFLVVVIYTQKSLYNDREFLLLFNILLLAVMAIIVFSLSEATKQSISKTNLFVLLALACLTLLTNGMALSAIVFRLFEYGITPNRLTVFGSNVLIFTHLIAVAYQILGVLRGQNDITKVEKSVVFFIPMYGLWAGLVLFAFPLIFGFA